MARTGSRKTLSSPPPTGTNITIIYRAIVEEEDWNLTQKIYHNQRQKKGTSLVAPVVKNPPAVQETWVRSLGREDPLEKEMATHSSIPAWKIPWTEEPGSLQSMGSQESDRT